MLGKKLGKIIPLQGDITSKDQLKALAERVEADFGRLDVLVNNAGVMTVRHKILPIDEESIEQLQTALWNEDDAQ